MPFGAGTRMCVGWRFGMQVRAVGRGLGGGTTVAPVHVQAGVGVAGKADWDPLGVGGFHLPSCAVLAFA